jgi:hypothetical protein
MIEAHQASLTARHALLETKIAAESQRPQPDTLAIAKMKKEKLRLKEELTTRH